jgi:hypothetical protein
VTLAALLLVSACSGDGDGASARSSTTGGDPSTRPTVASTTTTATTSPTTTTTTSTPAPTTSAADGQATAACVDHPNGYRGLPSAFDDPSWTVTHRGEATLVVDGDLVLEAALELWLARSVDGVRTEHHLTLRGRGVATIAVDGDTVRVLSADTSGLERQLTSTIDGQPVATPGELVGLGDLLGRDFTMRCGVGSGSMGAEMVEPSGLRWIWGVSRGGRLRPPDPDA